VADPIVTIERLAAGGDGVGHLDDGLTVFVPRTAPGDRVRLGDVRRHRRHAFARAAEILEPGPDRVEPRCAHFVVEGCGGCQWQHLAAEAQRLAKARIVGDALRRLGRLAVPDPAVEPSPQAFGYRGTMTLTIQGRGAERVVGLHRAADASVFALERCEIAREPLNVLWAAVRGAVGALPQGDDVRLALRVAGDDALHVVVKGGEGAWGGAGALAAAAAAAGLQPTVWWQPPRGAVRRMAGPTADASAVAFEQVNAAVARALREAVLSAVPDGAARALDLYAGAGEVGLALAGRGIEVVTVEVDARAVRWTDARAAAQGLRLRAVAAPVEEVVAGLLPADVVVANPPRTGFEGSVCEALRARPPQRLVYVSCDPATLARDLTRLGATSGRLSAVRAFDMFPQTGHVETLVVLDREEATA
jgi:23S rRNA (uracil1939-C5)-methyltransferase